MSEFDFDAVEAWDVSTDTLLGVGNHVVQLADLEDGDSSGGFPQVEIRNENAQGAIRDWLVISPASFGKVPMLCNAAGVVPNDEEKAYISENAGRLPASLLARLQGKTVGIVVREEDDRMDPTKKRLRVAGYVPASEITGKQSEATPPGSTAQFAGSTAGSSDVDIPF